MVSMTENVNTLKDAIMVIRFYRFHNMMTSDLKLYSFSSHNNFKLIVLWWNSEGRNLKELSSTKKLFKVVLEHLIVVKRPSAYLLRYSVALLMSASFHRFTWN